jgi:hypothetical protein
VKEYTENALGVAFLTSLPPSGGSGGPGVGAKLISMVYLILVVLIVLVAVVLLRYPTFKRRRLERDDVPRPRPPGTADLDDVDAIRPDIDASALASARSQITREVPDGVLADALLDATPQQLQQMFAAVPTEVMTAAMGQGETPQRPLSQEELTKLQGVGDLVDDLEIWSFGDKN